MLSFSFFSSTGLSYFFNDQSLLSFCNIILIAPTKQENVFFVKFSLMVILTSNIMLQLHCCLSTYLSSSGLLNSVLVNKVFYKMLNTLNEYLKNLIRIMIILRMLLFNTFLHTMKYHYVDSSKIFLLT